MTDNNTPQAQAKAPMTTDEIINRLKQVSFTYARLTADTFSSKEVARDKQALTAAIQAVELLEQIKAELRGNCSSCKYGNLPTYKEPCLGCACDDGNGDNWEWRWPLGEEADHETH